MRTSTSIEIFTIGHSTRTWDEFVALLKENNIQLLADVRSFPGSRRYPWFNQENIMRALPGEGIAYRHFPGLGGRRKVNPQLHNTAVRNASFRGYADYMETHEFKEALEELKTAALKERTAYMCSEAVWWKCHRSMISDQLKTNGWKVIHIMAPHKIEEHPYTQPAKVVQGKLFYD